MTSDIMAAGQINISNFLSVLICHLIHTIIFIALTVDLLGVINREDVAALVVQALGSTSCTRMELTAIDPSIVSSYGGDSVIVAHSL